MKDLIPVGVRLKICEDRTAGLIRAHWVADDGSWGQAVSTLSVALADRDKAAFEAWVRVLSEALTRFVSRATGIPVDDITTVTIRPHESN